MKIHNEINSVLNELNYAIFYAPMFKDIYQYHDTRDGDMRVSAAMFVTIQKYFND